MDRLRFDTNESPTILIDSIKHSLRIKGWDREEVRADGDLGNSLSIDQDNNSFSINSEAGCMLRIPYLSNLVINNVHNDLILKNLGGEISITSVNGSAHIKNTNDISISSVQGDIYCGQIDGDVTIGVGNGNGTFKNIEGALKIDRLNGNATISGDLLSMDIDVDGSATLKFFPEFSNSYAVKAKGSIYCKLPEDIDAVIELQSEANKIKVKTEEINEEVNQDTFNFTLGAGEGSMSLIANGKIEFFTQDSFDFVKNDISFDLGNDFSEMGREFSELGTDLSNIASEITQQISSEITDQLKDLKGQFRTNIKRGARSKSRDISKRVRKKTRKAAKQARQHRSRVQSFPREKTRNEPVKDEERKLILEMVGSKTISVEDAEMLLQALEGNHKPSTPTPTNKNDS